jgi:hypothetical protein
VEKSKTKPCGQGFIIDVQKNGLAEKTKWYNTSLMKTALAIICSFVLAGTPFLFAQTPLPQCVKRSVPACCQHGCDMPCCQAKPSPGSQSVPAVPPQTGNQGQFSLFAANAVVTWVLPDATIFQLSSSASLLSLVTKGSPLYARNCARLI